MLTAIKGSYRCSGALLHLYSISNLLQDLYSLLKAFLSPLPTVRSSLNNFLHYQPVSHTFKQKFVENPHKFFWVLRVALKAVSCCCSRLYLLWLTVCHHLLSCLDFTAFPPADHLNSWFRPKGVTQWHSSSVRRLSQDGQICCFNLSDPLSQRAQSWQFNYL